MSRELLEKAAKAAGIQVRWYDGEALRVHDKCNGFAGKWNPLTDDGDAFRLAAQLNMNVEVNICFVDVVWIDTDLSETHIVNSDWGAGDVPLSERMSHIRLAIVRAAAAMGEKPC